MIVPIRANIKISLEYAMMKAVMDPLVSYA
jgi:hypothetical protein